MPISDDNYGDYVDLLNRVSKDPRTSPDKLQKLKDVIGAYEDTLPAKGEPVTSDSVAMSEEKPAPLHMPSMEEYKPSRQLGGDVGDLKRADVSSIPTEAAATQQVRESEGKYGGLGKTTFFYEPELKEAREELAKPDVQAHLGVSIDPNQLDSLDEGSDAYRRYAESRWLGEKDRAAASGLTINRYKDLDFLRNPFVTGIGALAKYGPSVGVGAQRSGAFGLPLAAAERAAPGLRGVMGEMPESKLAETAGDIAGAVVSPLSIAAKGTALAEKPIESVIGRFAPGLAERAAGRIATAAGSAAVGEAAQKGAESLSEDVIAPREAGEEPRSVGDIAGRALSEAGQGAIAGGLLGAIGGGVSEGARAYTKAMRGGFRAGEGLTDLERAGGSTNAVTGVSSTPAIAGNMEASLRPGETASAEELAAEKVSPLLAARNERASEDVKKGIAGQMQAHYATPEGQAKQSAKPVLDHLVAQAESGMGQAGVTGARIPLNPERYRALANEIGNVSQGLPYPAEDAEALAKELGGTVLSPELAQAAYGKPPAKGMSIISVPHKMDAQGLIASEERIYGKLKYGPGTPEGRDDPLYQDLSRAYKGMRDQYAAPAAGEAAQGAKQLAEETGAQMSPANIKAVKSIHALTDERAAGLSSKELKAVQNYTGGDASLKGTPEFGSALSKLAVKNPTDAGTLYRGTRMSQAQLDQLTKDGIFNSTGHVSSSYNPTLAESMALSREARGEIPVVVQFGKLGEASSLMSRKLGVSGTSLEREMLVNPGRFKVDSIEKGADGITRLKVSEASLGARLKGAVTGDADIDLESPISPDAAAMPADFARKYLGVGEGESKPSGSEAEPPGNAEQLSAYLPDGTKVHGLSALRRIQSQATEATDEAAKQTGGTGASTATKRVLDYRHVKGGAEADRTLQKQAEEMGISRELEEVPATAAYRRLRARAYGGAGGMQPSVISMMTAPVALRADAAARALSGQLGPNNPYLAPGMPEGFISHNLGRYLNAGDPRNAAALSPAAIEVYKLLAKYSQQNDQGNR